MEVAWNKNDTILLSQQRYTGEILKQYKMEQVKPRAIPLPVGSHTMPAGEKDEVLADATPYRALVGELNILAASSRPDITQALGMLARFMARPTKKHWRLLLGVI
ncbi:hypothetical protein Vafri_17256 [Volvox africanus]|uniref:Reverse transcriptase Ty1/copia-type domain-containing protein n=1 Tax=Volvox africanus TaxID=51714 RepID=A0A8J4F795_9CHLO|nr:hypothetical protein Vafri_17256 [Volvox africanus]